MKIKTEKSFTFASSVFIFEKLFVKQMPQFLCSLVRLISAHNIYAVGWCLQALSSLKTVRSTAKKLKPIKNYVKRQAKRRKHKEEEKIVTWNNNLTQIHIIQE